jgi:aspartate aminotransferase-like enzyme
MGYSSRRETVLKVLAALEELLAEQKRPVERGAAVAAARQSLAV